MQISGLAQVLTDADERCANDRVVASRPDCLLACLDCAKINGWELMGYHGCSPFVYTSALGSVKRRACFTSSDSLFSVLGEFSLYESLRMWAVNVGKKPRVRKGSHP